MAPAGLGADLTYLHWARVKAISTNSRRVLLVLLIYFDLHTFSMLCLEKLSVNIEYFIPVSEPSRFNKPDVERHISYTPVTQFVTQPLTQTASATLSY